MTQYETPFLEKWPKVSFEDFEQVEIDNSLGRFFYKGFFAAFHIPEVIVNSFLEVFRETV